MALLEPDEQVIILASPPRNLKCIQNDFSQGNWNPPAICLAELSLIGEPSLGNRYGLGLLSFPLMQKLARPGGRGRG